MKKNATLRFALLGALLASGSFAAKADVVTVHVTKSDGAPLAGVNINYNNGYTIGFGTTDANGNATGTLNSPSSFILSYGGTSFTSAAQVFNPGATPVNVSFSTTTATITAKNGATPVPNVAVNYTSGYTYAFGTTGANGKVSMEMFPGTITALPQYLGTGISASFTIGGNGIATGSTSNLDVSLSKVTFTNAGSMLYTGSNGYIYGIGSASPIYMFPGSYRFTFGGYAKVVDIAGTDFNKSAAVLLLKDHNGAQMAPTNSARGGVGASFSTYYVTDATTENGVGTKVDISNYSPNTTRSYEMNKNGSTKVVMQDLTVNNIFNFQTSQLTLNLKTCNNAGIAGGSVRYGTGASFGTWYFPGGVTDANGQTFMESFPATYSFEMGLNSTAQVQSSVVFTGAESYTWNTTNVKFNYSKDIAYGGTGDNRYFNKPSMELLPGTVRFNFRNTGVSNYADIVIGGCSMEKTPVIFKLINASNAPLAGGTVDSYLGGWTSAAGTTQANGCALVLLNGNQTTATSAMLYNGSRLQQDYVNLATNGHMVTYQTKAVTMDLMDAAGGHSLEGASLEYYAGAWRTFGTGATSGGTSTIQLLPGSYSFAMRLNGSRVQYTQNVGITPVVQFRATAVTVNVVGSDSNPIPGATVSYYTGAWVTVGTTDAVGNATPVNFLQGGSGSMSAAKSSKRTQLDGVVFTGTTQTVTISLDMVNAPAARGVIPATATAVKLFPNPAGSTLNIAIPELTGSVVVYSMDGRVAAQQRITDGAAIVDVASYPSGNYTAVIRYGTETANCKFTKQ